MLRAVMMEVEDKDWVLTKLSGRVWKLIIFVSGRVWKLIILVSGRVWKLIIFVSGRVWKVIFFVTVERISHCPSMICLYLFLFPLSLFLYFSFFNTGASPVCLSVCLSVCQLVCLSVCLSVCLQHVPASFHSCI